MTSIPVRTATGGTVNLSIITLPDGSSGIAHVLVDANDIPYGPAHPLLTAPAIYALGFTDRSGQVVTAGATILDIASDPARKGGSFRASPNNSGLITLTLKDSSGNVHSETLSPGDSYSLTVNGYVLQSEVILSGSVVGDTFSGVTYQ